MASSSSRIEPSAVRRTLRVLLPHVKRHRWLAVAGLLALLADVAFRVLEPWPLKIAIDTVSQALGARIADGSPIDGNAITTLVAAALALVVLIAGRAATNYASTICFALVGARVATELRSRVFAHVQRFGCVACFTQKRFRAAAADAQGLPGRKGGFDPGA